MKKTNMYCCSLDDDKEKYYNEMFYSFEEAKKEGLKWIQEYNENLDNMSYMPDDSVFCDELIDLRGNLSSSGAHPERIKISQFYIVEFERPEIPENCGKDLVEDIDGNIWGDITFMFDENTLEETLGEEKIKELDKIIYDFLDKNTEDYGYGEQSNSYLIEVE